MKPKVVKSLFIVAITVVMGYLYAVKRERPEAGPSEERPMQRQRTGSPVAPAGESTATVTLMANDGETLIVPQNIAFMSSTIKNASEEGFTGDLPIPIANKQELAAIFDALTKIQKLQRNVVGKFITREVQQVVNEILDNKNNKEVAKFIDIANFLDLPPYLINAGASIYVKNLLRDNPQLTLQSIENLLDNQFPAELQPYFVKHFELQKNGATEELSIADLISLEGPIKLSPEDYLITLNNKGLTSLEGINQIAGREKIATLNIEQNKILNINPDIFIELKNLAELYLGNNLIRTIPTGTFKGLEGLRTLNLNNNQIRAIPIGAFKRLENLWNMDLSNNQIRTIPIGALKGLNELSNLDLSNNQIRTIPTDALKGLNKLYNINLSNNRIRVITTDTLKGLNELSYLDLNNNQIRAISTNAFEGLDDLGYLDLSNNQIRTIPTGTFEELDELNHLDLRNNPLSNEEKEKIKNMLPRAQI